MKTIETSRLLRLSLGADALVSGAVALLHVAAAPSMAAATKLPHGLILGSGLFLIGYVLMLAVMARAPRLWASLVWLVIVGNLIWAVESLSLAAGAMGVAPNGLGIAWLLIHALTVSVFAALSFVGLRRSLTAAPLAWRAART